MDSGRVPAYRSSHLLWFHPYPRLQASKRERDVASTWGDEEYCSSLSMDVLDSENEVPFMLNQAIHKVDVDAEIQLRHRRLSMSSLVVDLALMFMKKA